MRSILEKGKLKNISCNTLALRALALAFGLSTILVGVVLFHLVQDYTISYTGVGLNPFQEVDQGFDTTPLLIMTPTAVRFLETPQPWDGKARVTLLVLGIDYRDWEAGASAPRSDSMMLVTIDPITMQAGMISIPRDLWVEIPGFKDNRINTAYMFGEAYRVPGGGPELAVKTVERLLGVPIQYFAVINFHTFERMIDELGGVDVEVKQRIMISAIGGHQRWLEPGIHHLDGPDTLAYARVRKGAGDDFGRSDRQQQVLLAVLERIVRLDTLPVLISRAPSLYQELSTGVRTNMSLEQMISLALLAVKVPGENIRRGVIGPPNMVGFYTRPDGAKVLRPVPDQIRLLRDLVFTETSAFGPSVSSSPSNGASP